jgi:hypothetical protein
VASCKPITAFKEIESPEGEIKSPGGHNIPLRVFPVFSPGLVLSFSEAKEYRGPELPADAVVNFARFSLFVQNSRTPYIYARDEKVIRRFVDPVENPDFTGFSAHRPCITFSHKFRKTPLYMA